MASRNVDVKVKVDTKQAKTNLKNTSKDLNSLGDSGKDSAKKISTAYDKTNKSMTDFNKSVGSLSKGMIGLGVAAAGLAGVAGFGAIVKNSLNATAEIQRLATMAGVSTRAFQELSFAASHYGITQDALTDGLKELSLRGDEFAKKGSGPGKDAFEELGYTSKQLNEKLKNTPALLSDIIKRMDGLDKASQLRLADEFFGGTGGEQFVAMIQGGVTEIDRLKRSANELGIVMDDAMIKKANDAKTKMNALSTVLSTKLNVLVAELAPDIGKTADKTLEWIKANKGLISQGIQTTIGFIKDAFNKLSGAFRTLKSTWDILPDWIKYGMTHNQWEMWNDLKDKVKGVNEELKKTNQIKVPVWMTKASQAIDKAKTKGAAVNPTIETPKGPTKETPLEKSIRLAKEKEHAESLKRERELLAEHQRQVETATKNANVRLLQLKGQDEQAEIQAVKNMYAVLIAEFEKNAALKKQLEENLGLEIALIKKKYLDEATAEREARREEIAADIEANKSDLQKWYESAQSTSQIIDTAASEATKSLGDGMANALGDFISGTTSAKEAFRSFASSMLQQVSKMIIQMTVLSAVQKAVGMVIGSTSAGSTIGLNNYSVSGGIESFNFGGCTDFNSAFGTTQSVPAFANGGVVTKPTLGLIGEAGESEAIIPLSKLDSMMSNNSGAATINVVNNFEGGDLGSEEDKQQMANMIRDSIVEVYRQEQTKDMRVGGSLYNYNRGI